MFIELVDVLRCPKAHEETWLVLAARRVEDRDVMDGTLGCPVCEAEYPIVDGIAHFDEGSPHLTMAGLPDEEEALRLAALLDLGDPRGYAVLVGAAAVHGPLIATMTDVQLLLVNPPADVGMGHGLSGLTTGDRAVMLPLARGSTRGIGLDSTATPELARGVVDLLRPAGRLVAPAALPVPEGVTELARDDRGWVAERSAVAASSGIVSLARRR
jgi:uncharacterized protein YbaR (Trm112 family)